MAIVEPERITTMREKQLSIFVENKAGRLAQVTGIIAELGINIRALSIADTTDFGILRIIVDEPEDSAEKLRGRGLTVSVCTVLSVCIDDRPGGLSQALQTLAESGIPVEYVYAFISTKSAGKAVVVMRVEDASAAEALLQKKGFEGA